MECHPEHGELVCGYNGGNPSNRAFTVMLWAAWLFVFTTQSTWGQVDLFETQIRPVLIERCYECHNSATKAEGGLALDHRDALRRGGESGPVLNLDRPAESLLLQVLRHEIEGQEMPQGGPKLSDRIVDDFQTWISQGAIDPRDTPPTVEELAKVTGWEATLQKRLAWWSFQPIRDATPPAVKLTNWATGPIDEFLLSHMEREGLTPVEEATPELLLRRLTYTLTGLPPSLEQRQRFLADQQPNAYERFVDELLDSQAFGECWARHWMDWIRYADSHGSEGDPEVVNAWMYRDYLIRALNADVPLRQLIREHIAGDLLENPRIDTTLGWNESAIGPAHWRMVFHGFAPTDALDEKVRFTDDQISAFSKAFLGITVSCARCHNHKFDPISQADYYAFFGILGSCRPGRTAVDLPERQLQYTSELAELKGPLRTRLAQDWQKALLGTKATWNGPDALWRKDTSPTGWLPFFAKVRKDLDAGVPFATVWQQQMNAFQTEQTRAAEFARGNAIRRWRFGNAGDYGEWFRTGVGLPSQPSSAGDFAVASDGDSALSGIYPAGVYSHLLSAKLAARLTSPDVKLEDSRQVWLRVTGQRGAATRYVVQHYPRDGTVYPVRKMNGPWEWQTYDMSYWKGDLVHFEIATARDGPLLASGDPRSWFGVREVIVTSPGDPSPPEVRESLVPLFDACANAPPQDWDALTHFAFETLSTAVDAFTHQQCSDAQAVLLNECLFNGLLPNRIDQLPQSHTLVEQYREWEGKVLIPTRVPALEETRGQDQPLFERGNHKKPTAPVPRRFLEAIDGQFYRTDLSGRLELADSVLADNNPLTRRVLVNRVWHHVFGRGIVSTPDNLGQLGDLPTHPELLDYLACRFEESNWSLKQLIRSLLLTRTWRLDSVPTPEAVKLDSDNRWLSHAHVRRLDAEALRDSLWIVSGKLQPEMFGPPVDGKSARRSVYVRVQRNQLDPLLRAFDFPEPFSTTGRRDVTNVPAQSLTLMNDPLIADLAQAWAERTVQDVSLQHATDRVNAMFIQAFGRMASASEIQAAQRYLEETKMRLQTEWDRAENTRGEIDRLRQEIETRNRPVEMRLKEEIRRPGSSVGVTVPAPIAAWAFQRGLQDQVGTAHCELRGGAVLRDGALVLNGEDAYAFAQGIPRTVKEKTLEARVQLDDVNQSGGGVISIQSKDGSLFDSLVFGEKDPGQWLAGSELMVRSQSLGGPLEHEAVQHPIHLALTYAADDRITMYREGIPYGQSYVGSAPIEWKSGESVVTLGLRHLPAGGNRLLRGRILEAKLYDRALTPIEIAACARGESRYVTEQDIFASLSPEEQQRVLQARQELEGLEQQQREQGVVREPNDLAVWSDWARAMLCFKEFLYVR